jgi:hypothetical protein
VMAGVVKVAVVRVEVQQDMHDEPLLEFPQRHCDRHGPHAQLLVT